MPTSAVHGGRLGASTKVAEKRKIERGGSGRKRREVDKAKKKTRGYLANPTAPSSDKARGGRSRDNEVFFQAELAKSEWIKVAFY